jgi:hypothetical protein
VFSIFSGFFHFPAAFRMVFPFRSSVIPL